MAAFLRSFVWAWAGICAAFASQRNLKVHGLCALLALGFSAWLGLSRLEWALLLLTITLVLMAEMLNTALETTLDLISTETHPQIKFAKDVAAGAVLITACLALAMAALLWGPRLLVSSGL